LNIIVAWEALSLSRPFRSHTTKLNKRLVLGYRKQQQSLLIVEYENYSEWQDRDETSRLMYDSLIRPVALPEETGPG
jgi:hypothetical protein